jgi:hypothetical protein
MGTQIINRGYGPEIAGTRITVYDVMDYLQAGWRYDQIRVSFVSRRMTSKRPSSISRTTAVMSTYQQILAQHRHVQYPPEVDAKLVRNRQKVQAKLAELRARQQAESSHARDHGGS